MLKLHLQQKEASQEFAKNPDHIQEEYSLYSSSLILEHDKYHDRHKKKKRSQKVLLKAKKIAIVNNNKKNLKKKDNKKLKLLEAKRQRQQQLQHEKDMQYKRRKIWNFINKKDIPKVNCY